MNTKETSNFQILKEELTKLSVAEEWDEVRQEWELGDVYYDYDFSTCLCTHYPIMEICVITNILNGTQAEVGNHCVNHFLKMEVSTIFDGLRRIRENNSAACNKSLANHAYNKKWINDWELKFLYSTALKRKPSQKQHNKRVQINETILKRVHKPKEY